MSIRKEEKIVLPHSCDLKDFHRVPKRKKENRNRKNHEKSQSKLFLSLFRIHNNICAYIYYMYVYALYTCIYLCVCVCASVCIAHFVGYLAYHAYMRKPAIITYNILHSILLGRLKKKKTKNTLYRDLYPKSML